MLRADGQPLQRPLKEAFDCPYLAKVPDPSKKGAILEYFQGIQIQSGSGLYGT